jgi:hypothetical protein
MLDVARIVGPSASGRFDSVCFSDKSERDVVETQRRIPGAIGFPGDFIRIVLLDDPDEAILADGVDLLGPIEQAPDERDIRERQIRLHKRRELVGQFPFDVLNLDLEEFLFKASQGMPGRVVSALRRLLEWQRIPLRRKGLPDERLEEFTLMFTTQVGPPNMGEDYLSMLTRRIDENLNDDDELREVFFETTGFKDGRALRESDFPAFFEFAVPKVLMKTLMEEDWHVDGTQGFRIFEFERQSQDGPYKMLHIVMDVLRNNPPKEKRAPGDRCDAAVEAYRAVAQNVFRGQPIRVRLADINEADLKPSLNDIKTRRLRYCPEDAAGA